MKRFLRSLTYGSFFIFSSFFSSNVHAQINISGIVNQYAKVTYVTKPGANPPRIVVSNNVFAANDKVMLIQMKGASIDVSNSSTFGTITGLNSAGLYEFGIVNYTSGDTVVLQGPICNLYSVRDSVQLIKVAVYTSPVTVTGTLTCAPWANGVGGVLVMDAGDVTLNADIDVSFNGFLGGNLFGVSFNCGENDYCVPSSSNQDGLKGEGIAQYVPGKESGRAPLANGGGGAGAGNAPAGGGANFGAGGNGGAQWSGCSNQSVNSAYVGYGGYSLTATTNRLFLGGGGGGPQHDNGYTVYHGGNGGGIVLIRANSITGNGYTIRSDGDSVMLTNDEGTSGGGAGGTIYLECPSYYTTVKLEAEGGNGGSVYNHVYITDCHAPGGGGGGGIVWFSTASTPSGASVNVSGGLAGLVLRPSSPCYNTTDYATNGGNGGTQYNLPNPFFYPSEFLHDTITCTAFSLNLALDPGYQSYLWSTGAATSGITVAQHGIYSVQATTNLGCIVLDTAVIKSDTLGFIKDTIICPDARIVLSPTPAGNFTSYLWQDATNGPTDTAATTGEYTISVITLLGCQLTDSAHVQVLTKPRLMDTIVCNNRTPASITLPGNYTSYTWSNGGTDSSITVTHSGTYIVHAVTTRGCIVVDTAHVANDALQPFKDTTVCYGASLTLSPQPATDIVSYTWQDLSISPSFTVTEPGAYYVFVKTVHNCLLSNSVNVKYYSQIYSRVVGDSSACPGGTVKLSSLETFKAYHWSSGDTTSYADVPAGTYTLQVTTNEGCITYDTAVVGQYPMPLPYIGPDTAICFDYFDTLNLYPGAFKQYLWQDKSYAPNYLVTIPGTYSVTVTDSNKCSATVERVVSNLGCPNPFFVPNAFTPNGDNKNDVFRITALNTAALASFELSVFNRWGQTVFHTFYVDHGWDGTFNQHPCDIGDYFWTIKFTTLDSGTLLPTTHHLRGDVTLIR